MPILNATITSRPQTYNLTIGRSVRLECRVDIKDTVVEWTKDGQTIVKTDFLVGSPTKYDFNSTASSDLIVKSVEPSDSGIYRCRLEQGLPAQVEHSLVVKTRISTMGTHSNLTVIPESDADFGTYTCEEGDWMPPLKVTLPPTQSHEYDVSYVIQQELTPGRYEAIVKVKNNKEWSHPSDAAIVNIVYRGNDATLNRPATVLLSTVLMYLLVRML
ncbi:hypothetical protein MSG28_015798 [Choristoneura fumiferana]|uniref:Uncharacterized protein n=1 Tax=Choristoneura fumiferana TaxID=7141 RepID=A0ACC0KBM4_CHOFU|nr:hypothetical protein MSG28_015798 [Choristoneura fumiferana]